MRKLLLFLAGSLLALPVLTSGCDRTPGGAPDASAVDLGTAAPPDLGCYPSPRTHIEILNACTSAQALDKTPVLPLRNPDGTLPPLP